MANSQYRIFVILLLLMTILLCFSSIYACKCAPSNYNKTMCEAKWVSHVVILKNETATDNMQLNYTIKHLEVFKSPNGTNLIGQNQNIFTPFHEATCGVTDLQPEEEYLLAGTVDSFGAFHINLCLYIPRKEGNENPLELGYSTWDAVDEEMKNRLKQWEQQKDEKENCAN